MIDVVDAQLSLEVTGPPLSEIPPGLWELTMADGSSMLAVVWRDDAGIPWYVPFDPHGKYPDNGSTDWTSVRGAVAVSLREALAIASRN